MPIKILKQGTPPVDVIFRGTCQRCRSELECGRWDGTYRDREEQPDRPGVPFVPFVVITCPTCGAGVSCYEVQPQAEKPTREHAAIAYASQKIVESRLRQSLREILLRYVYDPSADSAWPTHSPDVTDARALAGLSGPGPYKAE